MMRRRTLLQVVIFVYLSMFCCLHIPFFTGSDIFADDNVVIKDGDEERKEPKGEEKKEEYMALIVHIGVMLFAGIYGGFINYYLVDENEHKNTDNKHPVLMKNIIIGIGASLLVPLFLAIISSDLVQLDQLVLSKVMVFLGFCLIASISSRKFIESLSEKVLKEVKEAKEDVKAAKEDVKAAKEMAEEIKDKISLNETQNVTDSKILSLLDRVLDDQPDDEKPDDEKSDDDEPQVSIPELKELIKSASDGIKIKIFSKARACRLKGKGKLRSDISEALIAAFEALIEGDKEENFHRNHAQLALVLKDEPELNYERALNELSKAIEIRDRRGKSGFLIYEFNRAICKILTDKNFEQKKPSSDEIKALIIDDFKKAVKQNSLKGLIQKIIGEKQSTIYNWFQLNDPDLQQIGFKGLNGTAT